WPAAPGNSPRTPRGASRPRGHGRHPITCLNVKGARYDMPSPLSRARHACRGGGGGAGVRGRRGGGADGPAGAGRAGRGGAGKGSPVPVSPRGKGTGTGKGVA